MKTIKKMADAYAVIASGVIDGNTKAAYLAGARAALEMAEDRLGNHLFPHSKANEACKLVHALLPTE